MSGVIIVAFQLALIGISFVFFIFLGINVPLILFDKAMWIFEIVSGGDLVKTIIFGQEFNWTTENTFFVIYIAVAVVSMLILTVVFVTKMVGKTLGLNNDNLKSQRKSLLFWFFAFIGGFLLVPLCFFVMNTITTGLSILFGGQNVFYKTTSLSVSEIKNSLSYNANEINSFLEKLTNYKNYINDNIDAFNKEFDETIIKDLLRQIDKSIDSFNEIVNKINKLNNEISGSLSDSQKEMIRTINSDLSNAINTLQSKIITSDVSYDFTIDGTTYEIASKYDELVSMNSLKISHLLTIADPSDNNQTSLGWINESYSYYPTKPITKKLMEVFLPASVSLYDPYVGFAFSSIYDLATNGIAYLLLKIVVGMPALSFLAFTVCSIVIGLFLRVVKLLYLLITSPYVISAGITDDGAKFSVWWRNVIVTFSYIFIASFAFNIYSIVAPQLIDVVISFVPSYKNDDVLNYLWRNVNPSVQVVGILIILLAIDGATYGLKKMIDLSAEIIGERKGWNYSYHDGGSSNTKKATSAMGDKANKELGIARKNAAKRKEKELEVSNVAKTPKIGGKSSSTNIQTKAS